MTLLTLDCHAVLSTPFRTIPKLTPNLIPITSRKRLVRILAMPAVLDIDVLVLDLDILVEQVKWSRNLGSHVSPLKELLGMLVCCQDEDLCDVTLRVYQRRK